MGKDRDRKDDKGGDGSRDETFNESHRKQPEGDSVKKGKHEPVLDTLPPEVPPEEKK